MIHKYPMIRNPFRAPYRVPKEAINLVDELPPPVPRLPPLVCLCDLLFDGVKVCENQLNMNCAKRKPRGD